jgi:branched-chain amino acid transport system substrate-binding protein
MLQNGGFTVIDPGPFDDGSPDFTAQIALFQKEQCEILNSFMIPPDSPVFLRQAALAGLTKQIKICQVLKAGLVPGDVAAMGSLGYRITTGHYWHRAFPYTSPLTGQASGALADAYEKATGAQTLPQLGAGLALFDAGLEALKAAGTPKDKAALAKAVATLDVMTVNGRVNFRSGPVPNVAVVPTLGVQYVKAKQGPFKLDVVLVDNTGDANVPVQAKMVSYSS